MNLYNTTFEPMLLSESTKPFNNKNYIFEMKFDGTRALIYVSPSSIKIINKRSNVLNNTYPELLDIMKLVKKKVIFDGEIIVMENGYPSFSRLQERALLRDKKRINYMMINFPVIFVCFDILYEGKNLTNLPLMKRKQILNKYKDNDIFVKTIFTLEKGTELYKQIKKVNIEGIVAKKKDSSYQINTRSNDWIKIKNWFDEEFFICGYNESPEYVSSLLLGYKDNGIFKYAAKVVIGKKNPDYQIIKKEKTIKNSPLSDFNEISFTYINPILKCTVEFLEKTKNNHLRQPIYKGLRLD